MDEIRLNLLLFSVGGVCFGADAGQVAEISAYDGQQSDDLFWFHEELPFGVVNPTYLSPSVFTIRTGVVPPYRVIIDSMEDVTEFSLNDLQPFPALLEPIVVGKGLWGILPRNGKMVLLLDFQRLYLKRRANLK